MTKNTITFIITIRVRICISDRLKGEDTMRDKKKLAIGIIFLLGACYFIFKMVTMEMESYYITGMIVFTILGGAFIRNAKY